MNVVDSSVLVAASGEDQQHREWAVAALGERAAAPHFMPVEVTNAYRRLEMAGLMTAQAAREAVESALSFDVSLWSFVPTAGRVWELRHTVTPYDAWFVALAEMLDVPLATLDQRLTRATGPRCAFLTPFA